MFLAFNPSTGSITITDSKRVDRTLFTMDDIYVEESRQFNDFDFDYTNSLLTMRSSFKPAGGGSIKTLVCQTDFSFNTQWAFYYS